MSRRRRSSVSPTELALALLYDYTEYYRRRGDPRARPFAHYTTLQSIYHRRYEWAISVDWESITRSLRRLASDGRLVERGGEGMFRLTVTGEEKARDAYQRIRLLLEDVKRQREERKSRMFHIVKVTWNPVTGCQHECIYCWARRLVETRLKYTCPRKYAEGFKPKFHPEELQRRFRPGELVFVVDMGDLFGSWVPDHWIQYVLEVIEAYPRTDFLLLTKNPKRYHDFRDALAKLGNVIVGATIETDDDELYRKHGISKAPPPRERLEGLEQLEHPRKLVSVEPIIEFTDEFPSLILKALGNARQRVVYVGYDNYGCNLPEPDVRRAWWLVKELREAGVKVYTKTMK